MRDALRPSTFIRADSDKLRSRVWIFSFFNFFSPKLFMKTPITFKNTKTQNPKSYLAPNCQ